MARPRQSRLRDASSEKSRKSDEPPALNSALRQARLQQGLSQQELARKLGFRQRQISDLERAAMDARLSTIQNVARALDLELTLIPRHLISAVEGLQRAGTGSPMEPMYTLDEDDDAEPDEGAATEGELRSSQPRAHPAKKSRSTKEQQ